MTFTNSVDAMLATARRLFEQDRVSQAELLLRDLAVRASAREDVMTLLAELLRNQGRMGAAAGVMAQLAESTGFEVRTTVRAVAFARECDRHAVAARICDAAFARGVKSADLLVLAGHVARESGDFARAREHYLSALDEGVDLDRWDVLGALVNAKRYEEAGGPDMVRCVARLSDRSVTPGGRAAAGYALAKILNDVGDYAPAAEVLREANEMARAVRSWHAGGWHRFVEARQGEHVAAARAGVDEGFIPVFIVGLPRSGTTLAATLLGRATGARDRGELRALRFVATRLRDGGHLGNAAVVTEAAQLYRMMARQDDAPARVYIDQDPLNFRWLDIAAAMFPKVKIIHLRRDRRDTALSLWNQDFAHQDMAFSSDFGNIAALMSGHDVLMKHWKATLAAPIRELDYESLVANPDGVIADLAAFIGVSLAPVGEAIEAPVTSASAWQVRQPIYRTSIGRWQNYLPYVPELKRFGAT